MADNSYSIDTGNVVAGQPADGGQTAFLRMSTQTAMTGQVNQQAAAAASGGIDPATSQALLKLGGEILAPHIKAAATEQFMEGMAAAQAGQAYKEIQDQQPWYTQIFGPSSAVLGARTYTTQQAVAQFGADMEKQMPTLAKSGPQAMTQAATASIKKQLTGDPLADQIIMAAYADQMAPLYKRHAKENYIWSQEQASRAQVGAWDALADGYQQRAKSAAKAGGGTSQEDLQAEQDHILSSIIPFADQGDASYERNITHFLSGAAAKGNFHVINLFEQKGMLAKLPPEAQAHLTSQFHAAGAKALNEQAMPELSLETALFVRDTAQDPRGIVDRAAKLNAKAAALAGVPEKYAQLVPNAQLDNITGNVLGAQAAANLAAENRAASAAAQAAKEAGQRNWAEKALGVPGMAQQAKDVGLTTKEDLDRAALAAVSSDPSPGNIARIANARFDQAYPTIKENVQALMGDLKEDSAASQRAAAVYTQLGDTQRGMYFNAQQIKFMERYTSAVRGGVPPEHAFQQAKVAQPDADNIIPEGGAGKFKESVQSYVESQFENFVGWNRVSDSALQVIQARTAKTYNNTRSFKDQKSSIAIAMGEAMQNGLEIVGEHAVMGLPGQRPMTEALFDSKTPGHMGGKELAASMNGILQQKAQERGVKLKDYSVVRGPDRQGDPYLFVEVFDADTQRNVYFNLSGADLRKYNTERIKTQIAPPVPAGDIPPGFTPSTVGPL